MQHLAFICVFFLQDGLAKYTLAKSCPCVCMCLAHSFNSVKAEAEESKFNEHDSGRGMISYAIL